MRCDAPSWRASVRSRRKLCVSELGFAPHVEGDRVHDARSGRRDCAGCDDRLKLANRPGESCKLTPSKLCAARCLRHVRHVLSLGRETLATRQLCIQPLVELCPTTNCEQRAAPVGAARREGPPGRRFCSSPAFSSQGVTTFFRLPTEGCRDGREPFRDTDCVGRCRFPDVTWGAAFDDLERAAHDLLDNLHRHSIVATWGLTDVAHPLGDEIVKQSSHELAIHASASLVGSHLPRSAFVEQMHRRLAQARLAGQVPTTLNLASGCRVGYLDMLPRFGITALRSALPHVQTRSLWQQLASVGRGPQAELRPHMARWGVWQFPHRV